MEQDIVTRKSQISELSTHTRCICIGDFYRVREVHNPTFSSVRSPYFRLFVKRFHTITEARAHAASYKQSCFLKPISQLRFNYDTTAIWRYHDTFDYDKSDRNYDLRSIRLRYDYDTTTTKNSHVHFLLASNRALRRSRIVVVVVVESQL